MYVTTTPTEHPVMLRIQRLMIVIVNSVPGMLVSADAHIEAAEVKNSKTIYALLHPIFSERRYTKNINGTCITHAAAVFT